MSANDIISDLSYLDKGKQYLKTLSENRYPFKTPKSFDEKESVVLSKIIDIKSNSIRFRLDYILKGMDVYTNADHAAMTSALNALTQVINENKKVREFKALEDDLIIIDNLKGLHARQPFSDQNRHYIRARVTKNGNS